MATRLKTIEYGIPQLDTLTDNTLTAMTTITAYIPEFSGTVTFKSCAVKVSVNDASTTLGNFNSRRIDVSVGGAGATSYTNSNLLTGSGEQEMVFFSADCTAHFVSNWTTGTSKTIAVSVLLDSAAASGIIFNNVGATIYLTFEYDDTQATQTKTVYIPLNAPVTVLGTTKPSAIDTIPAWDYYCPESSKTFRNMFIVFQGNVNNTASTTDSTLSIQIDSLTAYTSQTLEMGATSDYWARFVYVPWYYNSGGTLAGVAVPTTSTSSFYVWASVARHNHNQAYMAVTYEFKANDTTTTLTEDLDNSETGVDVTSAAAFGTVPYVIQVDTEQMLVTSVATNTLTVTRGYNSTTAATHSNGATVTPCTAASVFLQNWRDGAIMGGTASTDFNRISEDLWIEEPGAVGGKKIAFYSFWEQAAAIGGLNMRLGTGSFVTYTDAAAVMCGSNGAMTRLDSAFTLARGKNSLTLDVYRTDTADFGWAFSGFFLVTYIGGKPSGGHGAANHTVKYSIKQFGTDATNTNAKSSAFAVSIPETSYRIVNFGGILEQFPNSTGGYNGGVFLMERTNAAGQWDLAFLSAGHTDVEQGLHIHCFNVGRFLYRWASDPDSARIDPEGTRRWWWSYSNAQTGFWSADIYLTYHTITSTLSGSISGSGGGTVNIAAYSPTLGKIGSTSRSGDGAYSITVYDNTESVFVEAVESGVYKGRSASGTAT